MEKEKNMSAHKEAAVRGKSVSQGNSDAKKLKRKKWLKVGFGVLVIFLLAGGVAAWKTGSTLNKISLNGNILGSLGRMIPGVNDKLKGEDEGRINILLLGMRGENVPGGGTLADTIMVASIQPAKEDQPGKVSFLSIPRDFYVDNPAVGYKTKINAVYAYGLEKNSNEGGIEAMKSVVSDIVGQPVPYALVINFKGFTDLVDAVDGIKINLDKPFEEALQFNEERVCDSYTFTKPTGNFENKTKTYYSEKSRTYKTRTIESYPLCTNPNTECGGDFKLPAGEQTLNGEQALCYARSRKTTSDFERARRQQLIIQLIKDKALSAGTLADFSKVNAMFDSLGDNIKTDMQGWELKRLYDLQKEMQDVKITQRVLENSEEGLLYNPPENKETGYILLPIGDNYDKIRELFANIFSVGSQSDIKTR